MKAMMNLLLGSLWGVLLSFNVNAERVKLDEELTLYYEQAGSGEITIIFIPGWMMSTDVFRHQLAFFHGSTRFRAQRTGEIF